MKWKSGENKKGRYFMFLLGFLAALGISGAKCAIEDSQIKHESRTIDEKGNVHYYDRQLRDYINGERVERIETKDANGVTLFSTVGANSHKIYNTSYGRGTQQLFEMSEQNKQRSIEYGDLAYSQYNPYFERFVTTEIATGRTIICLFENISKDGKDEYRKWYYNSACQGKYDYNTTLKGDYGIIITKEEYKKLNIISGSHRHIPSDHNIWKDLTSPDRYKAKEKREYDKRMREYAQESKIKVEEKKKQQEREMAKRKYEYLKDSTKRKRVQRHLASMKNSQ